MPSNAEFLNALAQVRKLVDQAKRKDDDFHRKIGQEATRIMDRKTPPPVPEELPPPLPDEALEEAPGLVWDIVDCREEYRKVRDMAIYTLATLKTAVEKYTRENQHRPPKITLTPAEFAPLAALHPPPRHISWSELLDGGYAGCKLFGIPVFLNEEAQAVFPEVRDA